MNCRLVLVTPKQKHLRLSLTIRKRNHFPPNNPQESFIPSTQTRILTDIGSVLPPAVFLGCGIVHDIMMVKKRNSLQPLKRERRKTHAMFFLIYCHLFFWHAFNIEEHLPIYRSNVLKSAFASALQG